MRAQAIFLVLRPVSPLAWRTLGMGTGEFMFWVRGFLEKDCVCPAQDVAVVRVELCVDDLLVMGSNNDDSGGKMDFDRGVHCRYHGICVRVGHRYDEVREL